MLAQGRVRLVANEMQQCTTHHQFNLPTSGTLQV